MPRHDHVGSDKKQIFCKVFSREQICIEPSPFVNGNMLKRKTAKVKQLVN